MTETELKIYLPKYLSGESYAELIDGLKGFPSNIDGRLYTNYLKDELNIFQGDCLRDLPVVNIESLEKKQVPAIILSNTCDIDPANKRIFPSSIVFAPIVKLDSYIQVLEKKEVRQEKIEQHLKSLKQQAITQILYLPSYGEVFSESIVFLDKIFNIPSSYINLEKITDQRILTLSDYGSYMFLFKLSLHFTRIQDRVDRRSSNLN
jgi:hypothetical protein